MKKTLNAVLPLGYQASGLSCGIKKSGRPDLALIYSRNPAVAAGLFTRNKITSGSLKFSRMNLGASRSFRAIIINSGNANCFLGSGPKSKVDIAFGNACSIAEGVSCLLKIKRREVLVASTGVIGKRLPLERIKQSLPALAGSLNTAGLSQAARAIITTDTFIKTSERSFLLGGRRIRICGLAKGAGMIAPNLATMLCFIVSDADISQAALKAALSAAVARSFNCISVDGCMSTNDSVLAMSNACAKNPQIKKTGQGFKKFSAALNALCLDLAQMIVRDAEGATKFIQIRVKEAASFPEARQVALSIANSSLFKAAMSSGRRNPGRVAAAVGASGIAIKEKDLRISFRWQGKKDIYLDVALKRGRQEAVIYTADLTPQYIKINAQYS